MFNPHVAVDILIRTGTVYCVVLLLLRLGGKRQIGQMTPLDLVLLLLISNAVQNAMTGPDTSMMGGVVAATTLMVLNLLMDKLANKSKFFRHWLSGMPTILINRGEVVQAHLDRENINHDELLQALRTHGVATVQDVRLAVLEMDGSISVVRNDDLEAGYHTRPHHRIRYIKRA